MVLGITELAGIEASRQRPWRRAMVDCGGLGALKGEKEEGKWGGQAGLQIRGLEELIEALKHEDLRGLNDGRFLTRGVIHG